MLRRPGSELLAILRAASPTHQRLRDRLIAIVTFTLLLSLVCALVEWLLERHSPGGDVRTYGDALFYTSVQLLTPSSSLANPVTTWGKVLDVFMELYGVLVVTSMAGSFGSFLLRRAEEEDRAREQQEQAHSSASAASAS